MHSPVLGEASVKRILDASLRVLAQVGCLVQNAEAREVIRSAGGKVEAERVYLPEKLVSRALSATPHTVRLADRRGGTVLLGGQEHYLSTGSDGQYYLGSGDDRPRPGTVEALVNLTRVAEALPGISAVNLQLIPSELGGNAAQLAAIGAVLANSRKHHLIVPLSLELAKAWVEMLKIADPGIDLAKTPALSGIAVTQSPLVLDNDNCLKLKFFADQGIPALTMPCPMAGASSPFTLAGTLVMANAEALLQCVLLQSYHPGSPMLYGGAQTIMDMPTGTVTYASPEFSLLCHGMAEISASLQLPCYVPLAHPDSIFLDEQCAAEKAFSFMNLLASDAHLFGGAGSLGKTTIVSCEQLVIDDELYRWARRYFEGIRISEETLAEEEISEVGPGGDFFATENTLKFLRSGEHMRAETSSRKLAETGAFAMLDAAHDRVKEILSHSKPLVTESAAAELDRYARKEGQALDRAAIGAGSR
ncbi:MAG: trimethylamine methyltransferase family protein [Anaerolineales bacterium]|jgi:trimethylamine--corrinoid protein Co-methyltransferase